MQSIRISFFFSCQHFAFLCNTEPKTKAKEAPADPKELEKEKAAEQITEVGSESAGDPERLLNRVSKEDSLPNVFRSPRVKKLKKGLSRSRTD